MTRNIPAFLCGDKKVSFELIRVVGEIGTVFEREREEVTFFFGIKGDFIVLDS